MKKWISTCGSQEVAEAIQKLAFAAGYSWYAGGGTDLRVAPEAIEFIDQCREIYNITQPVDNYRQTFRSGEILSLQDLVDFLKSATWKVGRQKVDVTRQGNLTVHTDNGADVSIDYATAKRIFEAAVAVRKCAGLSV
jgi:hypothetical protein